MAKGTFTVTFLADGGIKIETDKFAEAIHTQADKFMKELEEMIGVPIEVVGKPKEQHHHHHHGQHHKH